MTPLALPPRPRILVVALRRLGDVLLTTPLIASLRKAYPDATIDALVFADTAGILKGNPDLDTVVAMPQRRTFVQSISLAMKLWRRYDLAISTQPGDRPVLFSIIAGRKRVSPVEARKTGDFKRLFLDRAVPFVSGIHRVEEMLRLADAVGIARDPRVVPPRSVPSDDVPRDAYAVIHAAPMFRYKQWTMSGWRELAKSLQARGLTVVATGGPAPDERRYLDEIWQGGDVLRLDGKLNWQQLCGVLEKAKVFVGPDTSVTHLAAACGAPTVALFGPTDPRLWGAWPSEGMTGQWADAAPLQRHGNVWLVQHPYPCMPCQLEGCERNRGSHSQCLEDTTLDDVLKAVDQALSLRTVANV